MKRIVPDIGDPDGYIEQIREALCNLGSCASSCDECMFDAPVDEFKEWLSSVLKEGLI